MAGPYQADRLSDIHWADDNPLESIVYWGVLPARKMLEVADVNICETEGDWDLAHIMLNTIGQKLEEIQETLTRLDKEWEEAVSEKPKEEGEP